jgi:hypothetical protein
MLSARQLEMVFAPCGQPVKRLTPFLDKHYHLADHYSLGLAGAGEDAAVTETGIERCPPSLSENHATAS